MSWFIWVNRTGILTCPQIEGAKKDITVCVSIWSQPQTQYSISVLCSSLNSNSSRSVYCMLSSTKRNHQNPLCCFIKGPPQGSLSACLSLFFKLKRKVESLCKSILLKTGKKQKTKSETNVSS